MSVADHNNNKKIERIIIITGSKGGGGKTPVATSIALSLYDNNVPILACDFNFNNHDMHTILHGTNVPKRRKKGWLNEYTFGVDRFWRIDNKFWLNRWESVVNLGLPSTSDLWGKIEELVSLDFPPQAIPKVLVIDTNLTLPLICPPATEIQDYDLPPIEVVHLWSPSIVLQIDEQDRFERAIDLLNRFSSGFEERMTHIFTPRHYKASGILGTFSSIARGEFNVSEKLKFKQSTPKPIRFSELKDVIFANFLPDVLNYRSTQELKIEDLLKQWFENIIEKLKDRDYKTDNVLIIPTVVHDIALLVEKLTLKPRRTLETISNDLGTLYELIEEHILEYRPDLLEYSLS